LRQLVDRMLQTLFQRLFVAVECCKLFLIKKIEIFSLEDKKAKEKKET